MANRFLATEDSLAGLIARVTLGVIFFPHGAQKFLGWFGGAGFNGTIDHFATTWGVASLLAALVIFAEFFGSLGLIAGFLTRISALGLAIVMLGAILIGGHLEHGFFMNWTGQQAGEGYEFHLLAIGMAATVMTLGGGRWSVDRALAGRRGRPVAR